MSNRDKFVECAREYVRHLNITGQRHASRENLLFCEAIEAAEKADEDPEKAAAAMDAYRSYADVIKSAAGKGEA